MPLFTVRDQHSYRTTGGTPEQCASAMRKWWPTGPVEDIQECITDLVSVLRERGDYSLHADYLGVVINAASPVVAADMSAIKKRNLSNDQLRQLANNQERSRWSGQV